MKIRNIEEMAKTWKDTVEAYKMLRDEIDKISANEALNAKIYLLQQMASIQGALIEVKKTVSEINEKGYYTPKETA